LVLAIDDDPNILELVGAIVRHKKFDFAKAGTEASALARAHERLPQLVFMDINLPDTNGFDLCQKMRDKVAGFDAPVIFLSASRSADDVKKAMAMGGTDYMVKPFTPDAIMARLDKWLGDGA
jgi:two-component system OmpR family response regulator